MGMTNALNLLCGLALFLYGMHVMGEGLTRASGGRLEGILESLTKSKIKAVLLGAAVTAVIQSSSATTVMVVGFVNSGIMRLSQAAGVIMGANIGTTITSWILSLTGLQGDSLLLTLCKPATFTPVLAFIGVCLLLFAKGDKKHDAGSIMIGFAVLMTGMEMMSGAVKPLANVPEFTNLLLMFTNPILGVIAGALLTAIIQSSSASVGILQALCVTGAVKYSAALPIIMGQNIGTCVTALISSVGASKNAKRAALIHLYFNIIGTVLFMVVFYAVNAVFPFAFMDGAANAAGIAVIHTTFNIIATTVLLPFSGTLEKLATLTVRDNDTVERIDDFQLLVCASSASKDIFKNILKPEAEDKKVLNVSRITVLVIAVVACIIAWNPDSSIMGLVSDAWAGLGSAFGPLVVCSLFWKRTNLPGAVAGIVSGGLFVIIWDYLPILGGQTPYAVTGIYSLLLGFFVSLLCIVIVSLLTKAPSKEIVEEFESVKTYQE